MDGACITARRVRPLLRVFPRLFKGEEEKGPVTLNGTTGRYTGLVFPCQRTRPQFDLGVTRIQIFVLQKERRIAVPDVLAGMRHDVDEAPGCTAEFGTDRRSRNTKFLYHLKADRN